LLRIDGIMRELNAYQDEISSAVQSQSRVAGGIAREVMEVARCTSEIAEGASWVPQARGAPEGASDIRTTYFGRAARPKA